MKSDSYTPAIPLEELVALARIHGPEGLGPVSPETAHRVVEQVLCPCIRGEACVCEAIVSSHDAAQHLAAADTASPSR